MIDRIYAQILHPLRSVTETVVSLCPPFLEAQKFAYTSSRPIDGSDDAPSDESLPVFEIPAVVTLPENDQTPNAVVRVSDDFLLRPGVFHMQFAEYCLDRCSEYGIEPANPEDP